MHAEQKQEKESCHCLRCFDVDDTWTDAQLGIG